MEDLEVARNLLNGVVGRAAMVRLADSLLKEYKQTFNVASPPYDPYKIAALRYCVVEETTSLGSASAHLVTRENSFIVRLQSGESRSRRNYSCAHELGHTYFYDMVSGCYEHIPTFDRSSQDEEERRCNLFASALLMPYGEFASAFSSVDSRQTAEKAIRWLSRQFNVSVLAAVYRVNELQLENPRWIFLVMKHMSHPDTNRRGGKGPRPKLRVLSASAPREAVFIPANKGADKLGLSVGFEPQDRVFSASGLRRRELLTSNNWKGKPVQVSCEAYYCGTQSPVMGNLVLGFLTIEHGL